jgi:hypothetical protein
MLDDKLSKCLAHAVTAAFFRHLVKVVVRQVEFIADLGIMRSDTLFWSDGLYSQHRILAKVPVTTVG